MSTKDFKEGMVAGAKPFGDKLDQLANVSEGAVSDIKESIDSVNEVVNIVLDDLSAQEKKRIYDLDEATDISALEDDEKEFLVAVLTELANSIPEVTDLQRRYIMSVCSTVGIAAPQSSLNLACIENIDNMHTQKILLRHVMEFFFIGTQSYDFLDEYENIVFCYFSVNKRGINEIITTIDRIYNAMGIEGVANRYTFVAGYEELSPNIENTEDTETNDTLPNEDIDSSQYEKIDITGILSIQNSKIYVYKNITLSAVVSVNGELTFKHCLINFEHVASFNIVGKLTFENCEIYCDTQKTKDNYAIIGTSESNIEFSNCLLNNGTFLIKTEGTIGIENCNIMNCGSSFLHAQVSSKNSSCKIKNCIIQAQGTTICPQNSLNDNTNLAETFINAKIDSDNEFVFYVNNYEDFEATDLNVSFNKSNSKTKRFKLFLINTHGGLVNNCEIRDAEIQASSVAFDNCSIYRSNCYVKCISNSIISKTNLECLETVNKCEILNLQENDVEANGFRNCTFNNIRYSTKNAITTHGSVDNCIFANVEVKNGNYIINAAVEWGSEHHVAKKYDIDITNCRFINCYTDRSDKTVIHGIERHYKMFSLSPKITSYTAKLKNCMGLNDIKSGKFVEAPIQKDTSVSTGAKIGVGVGAFLTGGLGGAIGGAVGAAIGSVVKKNK